MTEHYTRKPNTACEVCGARVYRRPAEIKSRRIFCTLACYGKASRKEIPCIICGKLLLSQLNKKTCSRSCANKHRAGIHYKIGRPKDKSVLLRSLKLRLLEERGFKCERCSYSKVEILQVHHKDRSRNNNSPENLEIICPNCHYEEHYSQKVG